ncbi:hypothetical protein ACIHFD_34915 [Nonomuraea sp. NPDC051941]|uniref:hypothetical protein n=1 Tax=Nonomuraea sp. NPDC051941 TaxID=3364373 RepID=UPI0037CBFD14
MTPERLPVGLFGCLLQRGRGVDQGLSGVGGSASGTERDDGGVGSGGHSGQGAAGIRSGEDRRFDRGAEQIELQRIGTAQAKAASQDRMGQVYDAGACAADRVCGRGRRNIGTGQADQVRGLRL